MSSVQEATEQVTSRFGATNCDQMQAKQGMLNRLKKQHADLFYRLDLSEEEEQQMNTLASKIKILELDLKIEKLEIQIAATTDQVQRKELEIKLEQAATARDEVLQKLFETELQELRQQQRLITQGAQRHPSVHSLRTFSLVNHH